MQICSVDFVAKNCLVAEYGIKISTDSLLWRLIKSELRQHLDEPMESACVEKIKQIKHYFRAQLVHALT